MTHQIPYSTEQLTWHLRNNVMPQLTEDTIERIVSVCNLVNTGKVDLYDTVTSNTNITISEMLEDLKIDFYETELQLPLNELT